MTRATVYVKLLDEPVDVWRPVQAEHLGEAVYRILPQEYDREDERWEFEPGSTVIVGQVPGREKGFFAVIRLA